MGWLGRLVVISHLAPNYTQGTCGANREGGMNARSGQWYSGRNPPYISGCACLSRRDCVAGISAMGVTAGLWSVAAGGQVANPAVRVVDVHHHVYPPRYRTDNRERIIGDIGSAALAPLFLNWSPESAIEKMDRAGVTIAINSISSPGVWFDDGAAGRAIARECNEFGAQLMQDFPGRFGMFAAIRR
jgi:6-methylsalicylate decarboxylase